MAQRIALITGCSTGIGLSIAVLLAKNSFKVYASMRNLGKKEELIKQAGDCFNKTLFLLQIDVCSDDSVCAAVKTVLGKEGRVDVLINNAGYGMAGALEHQSMDKISKLYDTNVLGVIRVIRAVLPSMKKQKSGRIINMSSCGGLIGAPFNAVYCSSKFALEGLAESMAPELAQFNIHLSNVEPGPVVTQFLATATGSGMDGLEEGDELTKELLQKTMAFYTSNDSPPPGLWQTPQEISECVLKILNEKSPHLCNVTNDVFRSEVQAKYTDITGDRLVKGAIQHYFAPKK